MSSKQGASKVLGQKPAAPPPKDWEDEYHRLNEKHGELKSIYNEMEEHNRKLQARIRKLEADFTQLGGGGPAPSGPRDRDDETLVAKLYQDNNKLKAQNTALKEKNKLLVEALEKKKREMAMLSKKNLSLKSASVSELPSARGAIMAPQEIDIKPAPTRKGGNSSSARPSTTDSISLPPGNADNAKLLEVARQYKVRLVSVGPPLQ